MKKMGKIMSFMVQDDELSVVSYFLMAARRLAWGQLPIHIDRQIRDNYFFETEVIPDFEKHGPFRPIRYFEPNAVIEFLRGSEQPPDMIAVDLLSIEAKDLELNELAKYWKARLIIGGYHIASAIDPAYLQNTVVTLYTGYSDLFEKGKVLGQEGAYMLRHLKALEARGYGFRLLPKDNGNEWEREVVKGGPKAEDWWYRAVILPSLKLRQRQILRSSDIDYTLLLLKMRELRQLLDRGELEPLQDFFQDCRIIEFYEGKKDPESLPFWDLPFLKPDYEGDHLVVKIEKNQENSFWRFKALFPDLAKSLLTASSLEQVKGVYQELQQLCRPFFQFDVEVPERVEIKEERQQQVSGRSEGKRSMQGSASFRVEVTKTRTVSKLAIFESSSMRKILEQVQRLASSDLSLLLTGETSVGKEIITRAIVHFSNRQQKPFIDINCAGIPVNLLEVELFGAEAEAYSGRKTPKAGKFEEANGGTLLLDEIGDMPEHLQAKILRTIREREIWRVGGTRPIPIDVRIIAATRFPKNLRDDLRYRFGPPIHIPPLRERKEEISVLAYYFLDKHVHAYNSRVHDFADGVLPVLVKYDWPGNIAELESTIQWAVLMCSSELIRLTDLPPNVQCS